MKRFERVLKRLARTIVRRMAAGARGGAVDRFSLESLSRILVVRQDRRLGNLVLLTPLLQGLRRAAPQATITLVAPASFATLLDPHPAVDRVIPIDQKRLLGRPWRIATWRRRLREVRAELAIDASPFHSASFLNGLITWGSGAPRRLGYDREGARDFLNLLTPPPREIAHESVLLHDLLRSLRSDLPPAPRLRVEVPRRARALAARACRRLGIESAALVVGLHPGGRRQKRWPIERFETVAGRLAERGVTVVVFSGAAERPLLDAMSPPGPRRVYAPPTNVSGLGAYLCGLDAFISGDSGPMHLAAALGVPCVSIFRVDDHARYGPLGAEHRILYRPDGDVEPDAVVAAVLSVLEARRDQSVR